MKKTISPFLVLMFAVGLALSAAAQTDHATCPMTGHKTESASTAPAGQDHSAGGHQHGGSQSPYVDRTKLDIKALTSETIAEYRQGRGMGMAIPAELNGYPGPRHILDLAADLELTPEQRARIETLFQSMRSEAVKLGEEIIDLEQQLDRAFATGGITAEKLDSLTSEIAVRQGRLRATHLRTHIASKAILTSAQIAAYNKARGY